MCAYDFEYYVDPLGVMPWEPSFGKQCDCGHAPAEGEPVYRFVQMIDDEDWPICTLCEGEEVLWIPMLDRDIRCIPCDGDGRVEPEGAHDGDGFFCERCDTARRLLHEWCDGMYFWGGTSITAQIHEHWYEDELYRSVPFGRLVVSAKHRWRQRSGRVPVDRIKDLVDASLSSIAKP